MRGWLLAMVLVCVRNANAAEPVWQVEPDWAGQFFGRGVTGTALVYDEQAARYRVFDRARAETGYLPASTFKLFNALVALETHAVADEHEVVPWDGVKRDRDEWNRDQTLASALKVSAVWFYQEMARRAGAARMQHWIDAAGYGNRDIGGGIDQFWLSGNLRVSPLQQVDFLRRLAAGTLPFSARSQEIVRRISIVESGADYVLHAKTGWYHQAGANDYGWYVGWVERGGRRWFFAVEIDMPRGGVDAYARTAIARNILQDVDALPPVRERP